jgi:hypothetical protein
VIHMRWHKDGERVNKEVMVHPSDSDAWKTLDNFNPEFAQDARNIRIVWRLMASHLSVTMQHHTLPGPCLLFHTIFLLFFAQSMNLGFFALPYLVRTILDQNSM